MKQININNYTKLNLACGNVKENILPQPWLNVDLNSPYSDMQMDIKSLPDEWTERFWEVRASHVLEHFFIDDWDNIIKEWVSVLKPGGILRLALPDIEIIVKALLNKNNLDYKGRAVLSLEKQTAALSQIYGVGYQSNETDRRWRHRIVTDDKTLIAYLEQMNIFSHIQRYEREFDTANLHNIKDDSQNSWSMTFFGKLKGETFEEITTDSSKFEIERINKEPNDEEISAVFGFIFNDAGQLIVTKNERGWDIPGGHREKNENPKDSLIREVLEETSITIKDIQLIYSATYTKVPNAKKMLFYSATLDKVLPFQKKDDVFEREYLLPSELIKIYGG